MQSSPNWEWVIAVGDPGGEDVADLVQSLGNHPKVTVLLLPENLGIAGNTNAALNAAEGDFVAFLDQDDLLLPNAIEMITNAIGTSSEVDVLYSDEAKVNEDGYVYDPFFKPDWSPRRLQGQMYLGHLLCMRRSLVAELGLRSDFDGSQDHDLALRATAQARQIIHIREILYLWRAHGDSTAGGHAQKPYASRAGVRTIRKFLEGHDLLSNVCEVGPGLYRTQVLAQDCGVTVVIPTGFFPSQSKSGETLLGECLQSLLSVVQHSNLEIIVVLDSGQNLHSATQLLDCLQHAGWTFRLVDADRGSDDFNFSRSVNVGVLLARNDVVFVINDDVTFDDPRCIRELSALLAQHDVGVVAPALYDEDGGLRLSGVSTSYHLLHKDVGLTRFLPRSFSENRILHEVSAVTGAFIGFRKSTYESVGGFSEQFPVNFNDIDFCLKVRSSGLSVIWTPFATARHLESASRDRTVSRDEVVAFRARWMCELADDPFYPSALSLSRSGGHEVNVPIGLPLNGWSDWTGIRWRVPSIYKWDADAYLRDNQDVANAQSGGEDRSKTALRHFLEHGVYEFRMIRVGERRRYCLPIEDKLATENNFSAERYLASNSDVAVAIDEGLIESASEHFRSFGIHEQRTQFSRPLSLKQWRDASSLGSCTSMDD